MKGIIYKNRFLYIANCWFSISKEETIKCDIISYHDLKDPIIIKGKNIITRKGQTLVSELTLPINELFLKVQSNTRNKIRKAEKEGVVTKYHSSTDILKEPEILDEFIKFHSQFLISKNMKGRCIKSQLKAYCEANMLVITVSSYNEENIVFHVYVVDDSIARLLYSASLFRNENESENKSLIGNSNKLLHWYDMCKFKDLGYKIYDWGGYAKVKELQNINRFKDLFGGEKRDRYHYMIPNSLLGSMVIFTFRCINLFKSLKMKIRAQLKRLKG
jgi:hypothetical protein